MSNFRIISKPAAVPLDTDCFVIDGADGVRKVTHADLKASVAEAISNGTAFETTATRILEWAVGEIYRLTNIVRDADGVPTTADVYWPDGSLGVFTVTVKNVIFSDYDAFTITHAASGKTVTQPAYTRDADGNVTIVPAMTIA